MKRKIFSALMFGALAVASTTITSCKDYDDDINDLRTEITTNATDLSGMVDEKISNLNAEISSLRSQESALANALEEANSKLEAAIAAAKVDANLYADAQAAAAEKAAIEAAKANTEAAVAVLEAAIKEANEKHSQDINALLDADKELTKAIELAKAEVASAAAKAQEAAAKAQETADANAETLKAVVASLAEAKDGLEQQISLLGEKLDGAIASIAANKAEADAQFATVNSLISSNAAAIEALKGVDEALDAKIAANTAKLTENAAKIAELESALNSQIAAVYAYVDAEIAALKAAVGVDIDLVKADLAAALVKIQANKDAIDSNSEAIASIRENIASLEEKIAGIAGSVDVLRTDVDNNSQSITALQNDLAAVRTALENTIATNIQEVRDALTAAVNNSDAARAQLKSELESYIDGAIDNLTATFNDQLSTAVGILQGQIDNLKDLISGETGLQKQINDILETLRVLQGDEGAIATIDGKISNVNSALETAKTDLSTAIANVETKLDNELTQVYLEIMANAQIVRQYVNVIYDELSYETKRLKSLVFVPETYMNGIECIQFATLRYVNWGNSPANWEHNNAEDNYNGNYPYVTIDDEDKTVEYLVNPLNVNKDDIVSLSFISNKATDNGTRAANPVAPIEVSTDKAGNSLWTIGYNENGAYVMTLKLRKNKAALNEGETFGDSETQFTIVSLKADLSDKFLTDEEKEQGVKNPSVFSDWARLSETTTRPYIHNALKRNSDGSIQENVEDSHFWQYGTAYNSGTKATELPCEFNTQHIAKEVYYKDQVNLNDLVEVCDKEGNLYSEETYKLCFEFHLMPYKLKNENETSDATDQQHFGKLTGEKNDILVSTARDGSEMNRDAIGRQPMIQVVLKDTSDINNPKVVDVRYFKILWRDKLEYVDYGKIADFDAQAYGCGEEMKWTILEESVNKLYSSQDMSKSEFLNTYTLCTDLFASLNDATNGTPTSACLGTINWLNDNTGSGATLNMKWEYNTTDVKATQQEYENGYKDVKAYGYFKNNANPNQKIIFTLESKMTLKKMAYKDGVNKDATMWKDGARFVNPQLESDNTYGNSVYGTTIMLGDFRKGYTNNGQTPAAIDKLVNYGEDVKFVFDSNKLGTLASETGTSSSDWKVSTNGLELLYKEGSTYIQAAYISDYTIRLSESIEEEENAESKPTAGARLLVGHSVPVKLTDSWCELNDIIDSYNVNFLTPLEFTSSVPSVTLSDITAGGAVSQSLAGTLEIREKFTANKRIVWDNKTSNSNTNQTLVKWYAVESPVYNIEQATTNISKTTGAVGSSFSTKLSDLKNPDGTPKYLVEIVEGSNTNDCKVKFTNNSGQAIGQEFKVKIPITIQTKWQHEMEAELVVTIKPAI